MLPARFKKSNGGAGVTVNDDLCELIDLSGKHGGGGVGGRRGGHQLWPVRQQKARDNPVFDNAFKNGLLLVERLFYGAAGLFKTFQFFGRRPLGTA